LEADGSGTLAAAADAEPAVFETVARGEDDLAAFLYTSGTTGRSKGAMLTQRNLLSNARALTETWRFTDADVLLHALPIFHSHGLFVAINVTLTAGGAMIMLPKFDPDAVIRWLPEATTMMGVPTFYVRLLEDERLTRDLVTHIRLFVSGSAPLLAETHRSWEARTGHRILERYGMTETNMNTSNPYAGERRAGSVGFALPGTEVRVVDAETRADLPAGRDRDGGGAGAERLHGLLADAGEDGGGAEAGRVLHHGRPRAVRCGRVSAHRGAGEGPRHHRGVQRVPEGGGDGDRRPARRDGVRRDRGAAS
jgi:malonyl-CoA/methylmalonyl-CoA synthetase